jgi:hypothetical protein
MMYVSGMTVSSFASLSVVAGLRRLERYKHITHRTHAITQSRHFGGEHFGR